MARWCPCTTRPNRSAMRSRRFARFPSSTLARGAVPTGCQTSSSCYRSATCGSRCSRSTSGEAGYTSPPRQQSQSSWRRSRWPLRSRSCGFRPEQSHRTTSSPRRLAGLQVQSCGWPRASRRPSGFALLSAHAGAAIGFVQLLQVFLIGFIAYAILPLDLTISSSNLLDKLRNGRLILVPFSDARADAESAYGLVRERRGLLPHRHSAEPVADSGDSQVQSIGMTTLLGALVAGGNRTVAGLRADSICVNHGRHHGHGQSLGAGVVMQRWAGGAGASATAAPASRRGLYWLVGALVWAVVIVVIFSTPFDVSGSSQEWRQRKDLGSAVLQAVLLNRVQRRIGRASQAADVRCIRRSGYAGPWHLASADCRRHAVVGGGDVGGRRPGGWGSRSLRLSCRLICLTSPMWRSVHWGLCWAGWL